MIEQHRVLDLQKAPSKFFPMRYSIFAQGSMTMWVNRCLLPLTIAITLVGSSSCFATEDSLDTQKSASVLSYARLYVDSAGVSHFDDRELPLSLEDYSPPANPIAVHALKNADTATFVLLPIGASEDWHPAPKRQFAVIVKGVVEVTAGDNEKRLFGPGTIVLLEDTTGTGHRTRVVGEEESLTLMIAAESD